MTTCQVLSPPTSANVRIVTGNNMTFQDAFQFDEATVTSWDFSNKTFRMDIKGVYDDPTYLVSLTSASGQIVIDDAALRVLHFDVPEAIFAAVPPGTYIYDLIMTDAAAIRTQLMHGYFVLTDGVTGG